MLTKLNMALAAIHFSQEWGMGNICASETAVKNWKISCFMLFVNVDSMDNELIGVQVLRNKTCLRTNLKQHRVMLY